MKTRDMIKNQRKALINIADKKFPSLGASVKALLDEDIDVLYNLVQKYTPKVAFDIGTWIGTSAMIIDMSSGKTQIHSCDKHNFYSYDSPNIIFYNHEAGKFFRTMITKGIKANFVFTDARITNNLENVDLLLKSVHNNFVFATHDFVKPKKGWLIYKALQNKLGRIKMIKPDNLSSIAYAEINKR
jgi:predicted O-methyltransferase YrrM